MCIDIRYIRLYIIPCFICGKLLLSFTRSNKKELLKLYTTLPVRTLLGLKKADGRIKKVQMEFLRLQ
jgi:hypothetical protein